MTGVFLAADRLSTATICGLEPLDGESGSPSRWKLESDLGPLFAKEPDARREKAGWTVAEALGTVDVVAPVVLRHVDLPDREDATELAVTGWLEGFENDPELERLHPDDLMQASVFDFVVRHADRIPGHGNWLAVRRDRLRLVLIDHADAFSAVEAKFEAEHQLHDDLFAFNPSVFVTDLAGQRVPELQLDRAAVVLNARSTLRNELDTLIGNEEIAQLYRRLQTLIDGGVIPAAAR